MQFNNIINHCNSKKISISEQQSYVLKAIAESSHSIAAHDILAYLKVFNPKANRMTIYRALDYLEKAGIIHKISFNNEYTICEHLDHHNCQILICKICGTNIEFYSKSLVTAITNAVNNFDFAYLDSFEIQGVCKKCATINPST
jgi:Fur family transcriptional regulator, zinc uptake regulator